MNKPLLVPVIARINAVRTLTEDTLLFEVAFDYDEPNQKLLRGVQAPRRGEPIKSGSNGVQCDLTSSNTFSASSPPTQWGFLEKSPPGRRRQKIIPSYRPGQFMELSVFGIGECPISITSTPTRPEFLEFAVRRVGSVSGALHDLGTGDYIGLRGPFGKGFPIDTMKGKDIFFIAGGIGLAPLRGLINYMLDNRDDFGTIDIVYGARTPELLCFSDEFETWKNAPRTQLHLTVDSEAPGWDGNVGLVPTVVKELNISSQGRIAIACGPPIMIKFTLINLAEMGYPDESIITTLELKMKCGVGKCGRCNIGSKYVCMDGPVFRLSELKELPAEY